MLVRSHMRMLLVRMTLLVGLVVLLAAGCSDRAEVTPIIEGEYREATQILALTVASCNAELSSEVVETSTEVRVTVTAKGGDAADCADGLEVRLDQPLDVREVVDGHGCGVVEVMVDR
jgi:hypothetical protein